MYERVEQLLVDKAELNANHDGVPAAARHFHGACHELTMLLMQARDRLITLSFPGGPHRPSRAPLGVPDLVATRVAAEKPSEVPATEGEAAGRDFDQRKIGPDPQELGLLFMDRVLVNDLDRPGDPPSDRWDPALVAKHGTGRGLEINKIQPFDRAAPPATAPEASQPMPDGDLSGAPEIDNESAPPGPEEPVQAESPVGDRGGEIHP